MLPYSVVMYTLLLELVLYGTYNTVCLVPEIKVPVWAERPN